MARFESPNCPNCNKPLLYMDVPNHKEIYCRNCHVSWNLEDEDLVKEAEEKGLPKKVNTRVKVGF